MGGGAAGTARSRGFQETENEEGCKGKKKKKSSSPITSGAVTNLPGR